VKIIPLIRNDLVYSANSYLVLGSWNRIEDINTVIDVGTDAHVVGTIEQSATGVGKRPVEQVILTHNHFDHMGGLPAVIERYHPRVYAFVPGEGVDVLLKDGQLMYVGDEFCQVIHTPGHSSDSICIYCPSQKSLFSGDVPLCIRTPGSTYTQDFVDALERIARLDIRVIYSGHDAPIVAGAQEMIQMTLDNVRHSSIVPSPVEERLQ
jgi:glyoxylase-like metal-dependent hydrolase (beta-lactamase superfamily II)